MFAYLAIEPASFFLAFAVVAVAAIPQALTGMGFGLLAASLLLLIDPTLVPATVIVMGSLVAAANAIANRKDVDNRELGLTLAGRLCGIGLAVVILGFVTDRDTFSLLIAIVILFAVVLGIIDVAPRKTPTSLVVAGVVSGVTGTITSVGAPPMGIVYQKSRRQQTSATLNAYFAIGGCISAVAVWYHGWLGWRDIRLALALLPALAVGTWVSPLLRGSADRQFRPVVLLICSASAGAVIGRALF